MSDQVDDFFGGVGKGFLAEFDQELGDWCGAGVFDQEFEPEATLAIGLGRELPDFEAVDLPKVKAKDFGQR